MTKKSETLPKANFEPYLLSLPEHYTHHKFGHESMTHGYIVKNDKGAMVSMIYTEDGQNIYKIGE